jgi:hypothetical protein
MSAPLARHTHDIELADEVTEYGGTVGGALAPFLIVDADDAPSAECQRAQFATL